MARFAIRNITKVLQSASGRLFGRLTAGDGPGEELTPTQVRSLCSVYSTSEVDAIAAAKLSLSGGTLTGNLLFTDNTYDIGASGATRPRTLYVGTSVITPMVNNPSAALAIGNATYGVTASGLLAINGPTGASGGVSSLQISDGANATFRMSFENANRIMFSGNEGSHNLSFGGKSGVTSGSPFTERFRVDNIANQVVSYVSFVCAGITASGALNFPPITKAALLVLTPTAATAGRWRVTDATPASREAYPDGTNWRYTSDDTIVV